MANLMNNFSQRLTEAASLESYGLISEFNELQIKSVSVLRNLVWEIHHQGRHSNNPLVTCAAFEILEEVLLLVESKQLRLNEVLTRKKTETRPNSQSGKPSIIYDEIADCHPRLNCEERHRVKSTAELIRSITIDAGDLQPNLDCINRQNLACLTDITSRKLPASGPSPEEKIDRSQLETTALDPQETERGRHSRSPCQRTPKKSENISNNIKISPFIDQNSRKNLDKNELKKINRVHLEKPILRSSVDKRLVLACNQLKADPRGKTTEFIRKTEIKLKNPQKIPETNDYQKRPIFISQTDFGSSASASEKYAGSAANLPPNHDMSPGHHSAAQPAMIYKASLIHRSQIEPPSLYHSTQPSASHSSAKPTNVKTFESQFFKKRIQKEFTRPSDGHPTHAESLHSTPPGDEFNTANCIRHNSDFQPRKTLAPNQLLALIREFFLAKSDLDVRCKSLKNSRQTPELFLYEFLKGKYGLHELVIQATALVVQSLNKHAPVISEANMFRKVPSQGPQKRNRRAIRHCLCKHPRKCRKNSPAIFPQKIHPEIESQRPLSNAVGNRPDFC